MIEIRAKIALIRLLKVVALSSAASWCIVFAYADWLRFSSPAAPDAATGQLVYEKSVHGVFYITAEQAFWAQKTIVPIWLAFAVSAPLARLIGPKNEPDRDPKLVWKLLGLAGLVSLLAIMFAGDVILAPIFEMISPPVH